jgi:hypothetical protein
MLFQFGTTAICSIGSFFFPVQLFLLLLIQYPDLPLIGFVNFFLVHNRFFRSGYLPFLATIPFCLEANVAINSVN